MSPTANNSIDLVEAFAAAIAQHNLDGLLNIPAVTLEDSIDEVMDTIEKDLERLAR